MQGALGTFRYASSINTFVKVYSEEPEHYSKDQQLNVICYAEMLLIDFQLRHT